MGVYPLYSTWFSIFLQSDLQNNLFFSCSRLSEEFDVCPATVKRVLSQLRDWDLVDGERGKCVRINPKASGMAMEELMRKDPRITGVFASCDVIALGVYAYAVKHSRSIPHDLAVIGFDNQGFCRTVYPQISTFSENVPETAAILFELVKKVLANAATPLQHHTVSPKLLIRGSTTGKESR